MSFGFDVERKLCTVILGRYGRNMLWVSPRGVYIMYQHLPRVIVGRLRAREPAGLLARRLRRRDGTLGHLAARAVRDRRRRNRGLALGERE